jgi:putative sigma-54 modulation protein
MITHIDITGLNLELSDDIKKYVRKKIGLLGKYLPRDARKSARADVKVRQTNNRLGNKYECEVILHLPQKQLAAKESTMNMFAAVDIVEQKLKNQVIKYKQDHIAHLKHVHPNILARLRARFLG